MNKKALKFTLKPLAVMLMSMLVFSCASEPEKKTEKASSSTQEKNVLATVPIQFINPTYTLSVPAEVEPYNEVAIHAKVKGFVKKMYVDRGDKVKKGQLLALLEAPEVEQQFLSDKSMENKMQSDYLFSKQSYERMQEASETEGAVATIELERAKNMMLSAKSAYESSKAGSAKSSQLSDYLKITAPFDGIINKRYLSAGSLVGAGKNIPLFEMAESDRLRLTLSLPEKHAGSVKKGMPASFKVSSRPGKTFEAELSRTSGTLNKNDRSLALEFDVDNKDGQLQGGDYAQVQLELKRDAPSYWVPNSSVLNIPKGVFVMTYDKKESMVKRIPVHEGVQNDSLTEVFGELSKKDAVLKNPSEEIKTGKLKQ